MVATQKEHKLLKQMLSDSIVSACETSLSYMGCFSVDALVGVQLDDGQVFIVNLHKSHSVVKPVNTTVIQASADDDETSLDMRVDEIACVKQESSKCTRTETIEQIGGERRSKRLEKKRLISRKSSLSRAATKSNRKKWTLTDRTEQTRLANNTSPAEDYVCVTQHVNNKYITEKEYKLCTAENFGGVTDCAQAVETNVKHFEFNHCNNDDIDRVASSQVRLSSTHQTDRILDGTSDKAITEFISDELSQYTVDVGRNQQGTNKKDGDMVVVSDNMVKWTCHVCGYSSAHKNNFERHLFLHDLTPDGKSHVCSECGKRCRDSHELRTHVSVKHRKQLFRCARCDDGGKAFQSQKALRYHVATKHTGEFRYRCAVCDKTFLYGAHFRTHMNVHDGVRQLCAYCGRQFNYRASLKKHMDTCVARREEGPTPAPVNFRCQHCDRTFRSRSYLTDHVQTRHLRTRRYACALCGATFLYRTGLARHRAKCASSAPGDKLGADGDGSELIARPQEETTFVDLLAEAGSDVALLSAALQYVSHNTEQLATSRDHVTASLDISAAVTSLSTTAPLTVASPDDVLSTTTTLTMASPDDVLSSTAALTLASSDDVLSTRTALTVPGTDVLTSDGLQYVSAAYCQPTEQQCTTGTCVESLQSGSATQLFSSCPNSTLSTLHLSDATSPHQDTMTATSSNDGLV